MKPRIVHPDLRIKSLHVTTSTPVNTVACFSLAALLVFCCSSSSQNQRASNSSSPCWIVPLDSTLTTLSPCPVLRRSFRLPGRPVGGTVRIVGLGHFELSVNGNRVGTSLIGQPWSQYNRTIYYQEFDLGDLLTGGENVFGIQLGNSFWSVGAANDTGRFVKTDAMPDFSSGHPYMVWLEARVKMKDGSEIVIGSDGQWKWAGGPLTFSHIYAGEDFDARLVQKGWNASGFDARGWGPVEVVPAPGAALVRYEGPPIKACEVFTRDTILAPGQAEYTYLFPQNSSALLRFTVAGAAGKRIRFKPCEYVDLHGCRGGREENPLQALRVCGPCRARQVHLYLGNKERHLV